MMTTMTTIKQNDMDSEVTRSVAEVQAQLVIAQKFPRNVNQCRQMILDECQSDIYLAQSAIYSLPRAGRMIEGPSIRLAEAVARNWGHLEYGLKELYHSDGESKVTAYCWDKQTNNTKKVEFIVKHVLYTKKGVKEIKDPQEVLNKIAAIGARKVRETILASIPQYIIKEAESACRGKVAAGFGSSKREKIKDLVDQFKFEHQVTIEVLENYLSHSVDEMNKDEYVQLLKIFNSIKDGMTSRDEWFDLKKKTVQPIGMTTTKTTPTIEIQSSKVSGAREI